MPSRSLLVVVPTRLATELCSAVVAVLTNVVVFVWDVGLALYNVLTPRLHCERVVPAGCIGENGVWPPYVPPKEGDSRGSCPALNAMANHGACLSAAVLQTTPVARSASLTATCSRCTVWI